MTTPEEQYIMMQMQRQMLNSAPDRRDYYSQIQGGSDIGGIEGGFADMGKSIRAAMMYQNDKKKHEQDIAKVAGNKFGGPNVGDDLSKEIQKKIEEKMKRRMNNGVY